MKKYLAFGRVKWRIAATLLATGLIVLFGVPVWAGPGDAGDLGQAAWQNAGAIKYDGKTYFDNHQQYDGKRVFGESKAARCTNTGTNLPRDFLAVENDRKNAKHFTIPTSTSGVGGNNCNPVTKQSVFITDDANSNVLFYRSGDNILTFNGRGGQFTLNQSQRAAGGGELFVNGAGNCADVIVHDADGTWYIFPMSTTSSVQQGFPLNENNVSEKYSEFIGETFIPGTNTRPSDLDCRVNSLELTEQGSYQLAGFHTDSVTIGDYTRANDCEGYNGGSHVIRWGQNDAPEATPGAGVVLPQGFNINIPRYVLGCQTVPPCSTIIIDNWAFRCSAYTYAKTVADDNLLLDLSPNFSAAFFDDGYKIEAGVSNIVPGSTPTATPGGGTGATDEDKFVCEVDGTDLSLIVCYLMNWLENYINLMVENFILPFLAVPPISTIQGVEGAWSNVLLLANILFVLFFLIIIFAQATSIGISNYGIKSILPKLIVIAILANTSYFWTSLAVDISNIVGAGISALILLPLQNAPVVAVNVSDGVFGFMGGLGTIGVVAAASAAAGGVIPIILAIAIPLFVGSLIAMLLLLLRLVLIVGFVIFSPIILMGFVLPGTARMAGRLQTGFVALLAAGSLVFAFIALTAYAGYIIDAILPRN